MKHRQLLQLLRDNAAPRAEGTPPAVRSETTGDGQAHVYVYDVIDAWFGASAAGLVQALAGFRGQDVTLHVNSPGGDVFEGRAMAAAIVAHDGQVIVQVDGLIASAATYLARAANEVRITDGGRYMIHNSWTLGIGDKTDLRQIADLLDGVDADIANDYARQTGASLEQVKAWMDAETWFSAADAVANKFANSVTPNSRRDAAASASAANAARWNLRAYAHAPQFEPPPPAADDTAAADAAAAAAAAAEAALHRRQANSNRLRLTVCA